MVVDRLGLTGIPAVRSETASSTGASALHEAYYKIASGEAESVLVLGGERMKTVNTEVATAILSKTVDPEERRFGFTMPALIALITQAWFREIGLDEAAGAQVLARLMHRAHALGANNPLAAFHGRPEPLSAYFDPRANLPVATPLRRKDCSPICDGAAALILTARPQAVRIAGLGSATDTSSILDRDELTSLEATRRAARSPTGARASPTRASSRAWWPRCTTRSTACSRSGSSTSGLFDAVGGDRGARRRRRPRAAAIRSRIRSRACTGALPTNLSGGLKARGHPIGGTGLFQICENYLQITDRFPNREAQVRGARFGISNSIGGPGNNNYVTLIERADGRRRRDEVPDAAALFESRESRRERERAHGAARRRGARRGGHHDPRDRRAAASRSTSRCSRSTAAACSRSSTTRASEAAPVEQVLAGQKVKFLVKDDGDHYFQIPRERGFDLGRVVQAIRRRVGA